MMIHCTIVALLVGIFYSFGGAIVDFPDYCKRLGIKPVTFDECEEKALIHLSNMRNEENSIWVDYNNITNTCSLPYSGLHNIAWNMTGITCRASSEWHPTQYACENVYNGNDREWATNQLPNETAWIEIEVPVPIILKGFAIVLRTHYNHHPKIINILLDGISRINHTFAQYDSISIPGPLEYINNTWPDPISKVQIYLEELNNPNSNSPGFEEIMLCTKE